MARFREFGPTPEERSGSKGAGPDGTIGPLLFSVTDIFHFWTASHCETLVDSLAGALGANVRADVTCVIR